MFPPPKVRVAQGSVLYCYCYCIALAQYAMRRWPRRPPGTSLRDSGLWSCNRPTAQRQTRRGEVRSFCATWLRCAPVWEKKGNRMYNQIADLPDCRPERYIFAAALQPSLLLVVRCFRVSHMKRRSLSATPHWWVGSLRLSWLAPWLTAE